MSAREKTRRLGVHGPAVFPLSLGCMGMSATYGPADEVESLATIRAALDAGVTLVDTGDFYGVGRNELLLGRAHGVLSRGLLAGSTPAGPGDIRAHFPRFSGENRARNQALVDALGSLAAGKGVTATQMAIAWVLAKGETMVPVVGARTRAQLAESLGALDVELSPDEARRLEETVPASAVAGARYNADAMRTLDSER